MDADELCAPARSHCAGIQEGRMLSRRATLVSTRRRLCLCLTLTLRLFNVPGTRAPHRTPQLPL